MGAHVAIALALLGLAVTCYLQSGNPPQSHSAALLSFAVLFVCAAVVVMLHARDRLPASLRSLLDGLIGPPPHRADPQPDMKLIDVLADACSCAVTVDTAFHPVFPPDKAQHIADALKEIGQQARLKRLSVWGREDTAVHSPYSVPLSPIPAEQWQTLRLDYNDFRVFAPGMANPVRTGSTPHYLDIWLNRRQVRSFPFPHRRRRWQLRSPIFQA